jgi:integrase
MPTIAKRTDATGRVTYQAKVRKQGYPVLSKTFPDRDMAVAWAQEAELNIYKGQTVQTLTGNTTTVGQLVSRYIVEVTPTKKGADQERFHFKAIQDSPLVKYTVSTLSTEAVRNWRNERVKHRAPSTVNRELNMLHHVIEYARKEWGISGGPNPVSDVQRPKNPPARDRRFREGEYGALLLASDESRGGYLRDIIILAVETAMRQAELVGLEWVRVDFNRKMIRLRDGETKNGEGRGIPLSTRAIEVLKRRLPGEDDAPQKLVFPDLTTEAVKRAFIRAADRAKLEDFHFHDLRHEATSRLFEAGFNIMEVASITGHKDLRMLKRYTHLDAAKLAERMG